MSQQHAVMSQLGTLAEAVAALTTLQTAGMAASAEANCSGPARRQAMRGAAAGAASRSATTCAVPKQPATTVARPTIPPRHLAGRRFVHVLVQVPERSLFHSDLTLSNPHRVESRDGAEQSLLRARDSIATAMDRFAPAAQTADHHFRSHAGRCSGAPWPSRCCTCMEPCSGRSPDLSGRILP